MNQVVGEFIVERVISELAAGCIFSARDAHGTLSQVKYNWPKGRPLAPVAGEAYSIQGVLGSWRDKYGNIHAQIQAQNVERVRTSGRLMKPWLERLPSVGATRAERLVNTYGSHLPEVLNDATRLAEVAKVIEPVRPNLALSLARQIYSAMAQRNAQESLSEAEMDFMLHLESQGVTDPRVARRIWCLVAGRDAKDRLQRNPYLGASLMSWSAADHLGRRLLRADGAVHGQVRNHPKRLLGALASCWREVLARGDTAATPDELKSLLVRRDVDPDAAIATGLQNRVLGSSGGLLRAPGAAWLENALARKLRELEAAPTVVAVPEGEALQRKVCDAETATGLRLKAEQHDAVVRLLGQPVGILQGGAGAGKTTTMKVLVATWESLGGNVVMGALAGKAALQLSLGTSAPTKPRLAYTVARLVRMIEQARKSGHALIEGTGVDERTLLILDEASMLDTPSLYELVSLLPSSARLLLVGDEAQLPPIGIGKIFHDLVKEGSRVVVLRQQHRQGQNSPIPTAANIVRNGLVPELPAWTGQDEGITLASPSVTLQSAYSTLTSLSDDVLVVAATKKTVDDFNELVASEQRRPDCRLVKLNPLTTVTEGDPVVCTLNRYQFGLVNGLMGRVAVIEDDGEVTIHWDGEPKPRRLPHEAHGDVKLAYALTCHKAQGSAATHVIVVVEPSPLVTREWLYTAITRARRSVLLIGTPKEIQEAVERREKRVTGFCLGIPVPRDQQG